MCCSIKDGLSSSPFRYSCSFMLVVVQRHTHARKGHHQSHDDEVKLNRNWSTSDIREMKKKKSFAGEETE